MVPNHQSSRSRASVLSPADDSLDAPASMTGLDFHKKTQLGQLTSAELLNKIKHHQTMTQKQSAHVCACLRMSAHVCACLRKVPGGTWISCHTRHEREARANAGGQELSIVIRANMTLRYTQSLNQCFNISKVDWNVKVKCYVPF